MQDLNYGTPGSNIGDMVSHFSGLYFKACTVSWDCQLWRKDQSGINLLTFENIGMGGVNPTNVAVIESQIFFSGNNGYDGAEPWVYEDSSGAYQLANINPTVIGSNPRFFFPDSTNTYVFFQANDGSRGAELWYADGFGGVGLVERRGGPAPSSPQPLMTWAGRVYFAADDGIGGRELHCTNGPGHVASVFDFNPGAAGSNPSAMVRTTGGWFFTALTPEGTKLFLADNL